MHSLIERNFEKCSWSSELGRVYYRGRSYVSKNRHSILWCFLFKTEFVFLIMEILTGCDNAGLLYQICELCQSSLIHC